jgi:phenylpropionate dioxygenase-like ring-hydroxylating dioxygenase large terminal subunit
MLMFLQNAWYAAWWSTDLDPNQIQLRTITDIPILFWREEDGEPNAVLDRCPHRQAPLSLGRRIKGGIQCNYHGLAFDGSGACILNPHGPLVSALRVRSFPLVERYKLIWIWMGHAADADPALIPDLSFADSTPASAFSNGFIPTQAGHQLIADNILDLTHADYLHGSNLGGGALTRTRPKVELRSGPTVFVEWFSKGDVPPPFFKSELRNGGDVADIWNTVTWHPNGVMVLRFGATAPEMPRENGIDTWNAHIATPESNRTTHYFYFNTRNFRMQDAEYNAQYAAAMRNAFTAEDKPMLEGQQRRLGDRNLFDFNPVLLASDVASTRARNLYAELLAAELENLSSSNSNTVSQV